jgi:hypothetical protein
MNQLIKRKNHMKTKKFVLPLAATILVLIIVLAACGAKPGSTTGQGGGSGAPAANGTPGAGFNTRPLPLAESLLIGTFKLSGTSSALTPTQAAALVPLWQAYAQLTSSNTAAQAEVDAVVSQIQSTMTPQQVQAITAMKLTRQDLFTTMSSLGLSNGFGNNANGTPGFRGTPRAGGGGGGGFPGGGGGGGGFPGGGGVPGGGGGVPGTGGTGGTGGTRPTANPTQIALRAQFANRIPQPLMDALIAMLQKTAGT